MYVAHSTKYRVAQRLPFGGIVLNFALPRLVPSLTDQYHHAVGHSQGVLWAAVQLLLVPDRIVQLSYALVGWLVHTSGVGCNGGC
jgi:hypothetical protein